MPRPKSPDGGWEDVNQRTTFYCPTDLLQAINEAMVATGRSKTQVIVDALRADLLADTAAGGKDHSLER